MIASFYMHELPMTLPAHDALWAAVARRLRALGVDGVPTTLQRSEDLMGTWLAEDLMLGTTCGYPYVTQLRGHVGLIGAPIYRWPGCNGALHRSFVIVREDSPIRSLAECRGTRFAMNTTDSNSGMNLARAVFAPLVRDGGFFGEIIQSGAHLSSLAMVRTGSADVAAIDCVVHGIAAHHDPALIAGTRILAETPPTPCLPFIISRRLAESHGAAVKAALAEAIADPSLTLVHRDLGLIGLADVTDEDYEVVLDYERAAEARGYPALA